MDTTQQQLLHRMGIADAMAAHCRDTAGKLADRADEGEKTILHDTDRLRKQIRGVGVGADPHAEGEYCRLLAERRRLQQAWELSTADGKRFPDVPARKVKKSITRTVPVRIEAADLEEPGIFQSPADLPLPQPAGVPDWIMDELRGRYSEEEIEFGRLVNEGHFDAADEMADEKPFAEEFASRGLMAAADLLALLEKRSPVADRNDALVDVSRDLYGPHTRIEKAFTAEDARRIGGELGLDWDRIKPEQFLEGINEELEHRDVTGGDPRETAKIALAHLNEDPDYYRKLKRVMKGRSEYVPPDVPIYRIGRPSADSYLPLNGVEDRRKFWKMVASMQAGRFKWRVPLIRCGDQLLTGSHRYAACRATGEKIETKTLDSLFVENGLSLKETWERLAQPFGGWLSNLDACLKELPQDVLDEYGIDLG